MNSQHKRKGLSLSLSKNKNSPQKQQPINNIILMKQSQVRPVAPTIKIQYGNRSGLVQQGIKSKVIFKMKKSEWQNIRNQNHNKSIVVNAMKNQVKFLNQSIVRQKNKFSIPQQKNRLTIPRQQNRHSTPKQQNKVSILRQKNILSVPKQQNRPSIPRQQNKLSIHVSGPQIKHLEVPQSKKNQKKPLKTLIKLQQNSKSTNSVIREIPSQQNLYSPNKQLTNQFSASKLSDIFAKTISFQKKQNIEVKEFTTKKEKKLSSARQYGKKSIDISALIEIQNRLERLIEITQN